MSMEWSPKPYRVEWRFGRTHWTLHDEADEHEEAIELADAAVKAHRGEARVVVQHVIHRSSTMLR